MSKPAGQQAEYTYVARKRTGERQTGMLTALSQDEALARLHAEGKVVLQLVEARGLLGGRRRAELRRSLQLSGRRTGVRELALFTRQMSTIFAAGIPIVRGLRGLAADVGNPSLARAIDDVALRIERGETLSGAFAAHPQCFNSFYVSMLRAGEAAGVLDSILEALAIYLEKTDGVRTKVRAALSYPAFVFVFSLIAAAVLLLKTVPMFVGIYADMGQQLPALTRSVVGASTFLRENVVVGALLLAGPFVAVWAFRRTRRGLLITDGLLIRLPVFGPIVHKSVLSRVSRTLGLLMQSGVPILDALDMVKNTCGNAAVGARIEAVKVRVGSGQGLAAAFRGAKGFPEMVLQLVSTGEESGMLDSMILKGAEFYERQVDAAVDGITSLIEPILIVVVGGMIGIVVIAMFLPIFHMGEAVLRGGWGPSPASEVRRPKGRTGVRTRRIEVESQRVSRRRTFA